MARQKQTAFANVNFLEQSLAGSEEPFVSGEATWKIESASVVASHPPLAGTPAEPEEQEEVTPPTSSTSLDTIRPKTNSSETVQKSFPPVQTQVAQPSARLISARGKIIASHREVEEEWDDTIAGTSVWQLSPPLLFDDMHANMVPQTTPAHSFDVFTNARGDIKFNPHDADGKSDITILDKFIWQMSPPALFADKPTSTKYSSGISPLKPASFQRSSINSFSTSSRGNAAVLADSNELYPPQSSCSNTTFLHQISPQTNRLRLFNMSGADTTFLDQGISQPPISNMNFLHSLSARCEQGIAVEHSSAKQPATVPTSSRQGVESFKYQPLNPKSLGALRLLWIEYTVTNDIYCTLTTTQPSVSELTYECLSYVWGTSTTTSHIHVQDLDQGPSYSTISASLNLCLALHSLKRTHTNKYIWIDALCIDQSNLAERAAQVAMMKDIYSNASGVVIWLGDSTQTSFAGISTMTALSTRFQQDTELAMTSIIGPEGLRLSAANIELLKSYRGIVILGTTLSAAYKAVAGVFALPWFRRVWVLQEAFAHSNIRVKLGRHELPWGSIVLAALWSSSFTRDFTATSAYENRAEEIIHRGYLPELWLGLLHTRTPRGLSILELVARARDFEASDPRDKIFALLGLANDLGVPAIRASGLLPDYTKSKVDVYTAFARDHILMTGTLDVLSLVNTFVSRVPTQDSVSWMPDLDVPAATIRGLGFPRKYNASRSTKVDTDTILQHPHDLHILPLLGYSITNIHFVTDSIMTFSRDLRVYLNTTTTTTTTTNAITALWTHHIRPQPPPLTLLTATGFALPTSFPSHPLGTITPSHRISSLIDDFAAYCATLDPAFTAFAAPLVSLLRSKAARGDAAQFGVLAGKACHERKFFLTRDGRMGLGPRDALVGDHLVVLRGGSVPYVLWARGDGKYAFVGECYIDGVMFGETGGMGLEDRVWDLV